MPDKELFQEDQKPVTASVILFPKPGSDLATNRKKVEGIQKILKFAVEGLTDENIVITDQNGIILNDFANLADFDRLEQTKSEQKLIQELEAQYRAKVLKALQQIYTADRVRDLNIKIDMDMSKKNVKTEEYLPRSRSSRTTRTRPTTTRRSPPRSPAPRPRRRPSGRARASIPRAPPAPRARPPPPTRTCRTCRAR